MAENMDKVIDKIKKMFALAESANENEAATAMAMAHELLQKYNLSLDTIKGAGEKTELITDEFGVSSHPWVSSLVNAVADANYCGVFLEERTVGYGPTGRRIKVKTLKIVGKEHNIAACKVMATYILDAIERNALKMRGRGKEIVASYKLGFSAAVTRRLRDLKAKDLASHNECTALVVVATKEVEDFFKKGDFTSSKSKSTASNAYGFAAGSMDGKNLSLNDQISGKASSSRMAIA